MIRYLDDAHAIDPDAQAWARQAADALRGAILEVNTTRAADRATPDAGLLTRLRRRYDQGVAVGISTNLSRPWPKGNHPGLQLARRLKRKAHQVWLFTTRLDVPPRTTARSPRSGFKLAAKVQGCWRTLATLQRHCRIRTYLVSGRNQGRRPIDAIRDALTANPWTPPQTA